MAKNFFNPSLNTPTTIASTAAQSIKVSALRGTATVMFMTRSYHYTNVSRRAIVLFIFDDARSLGKFVNNV